MNTNNTVEELLQWLWEMLPDDIARGGNEVFYSTQIEPHLRKALTKAIQQERKEIIKLAQETMCMTCDDLFYEKLEGLNNK